jgi:hypothetical protein
MVRPIHRISKVFAKEERPARSKNGVLYPLDFICQRMGIQAPEARHMPPADIPSPYQSLLVHEVWMTETLERHFGGPITIRALCAFTKGQWHFRRSLLVMEYSGRPVEMGTIRINLDALPAGMREEIIRYEIPIGRLLARGSNFRSLPSAFLEITPNSELMALFWMREPRTLYGRQTEVTLDGRKIGDIVEILPLMDA